VRSQSCRPSTTFRALLELAVAGRLTAVRVPLGRVPRLTACTAFSTAELERLRLILARDLDTGPHFRGSPVRHLRVLIPNVTPAHMFFPSYFIAAWSVESLAAAVWAHAAFGVRPVRNDVWSLDTRCYKI
jgi:hypothetical protein